MGEGRKKGAVERFLPLNYRENHGSHEKSAKREVKQYFTALESGKQHESILWK